MPDDYEIELMCVNCGQPFISKQWVADGLVQMVVLNHDGCPRPAASMLVQHPRRLGVVTGITE